LVPESSGNFRRVEFYFPDRSSFAVHFTDRTGGVKSFVTTKASFRVLGDYVVEAFDGNKAAR
jgi:hypothetical protein